MLDFSTIKLKINKENLIKINEMESNYKINNCESRGHLQALKSNCMEWKRTIELYKQVKLYYNHKT